MTPTYRLRREVIDRAKDRLGCTTDQQLSDLTGVIPSQISRARHGTVGLRTCLALMEAAGIESINAGIQKVA